MGVGVENASHIYSISRQFFGRSVEEHIGDEFGLLGKELPAISIEDDGGDGGQFFDEGDVGGEVGPDIDVVLSFDALAVPAPHEFQLAVERHRALETQYLQGELILEGLLAGPQLTPAYVAHLNITLIHSKQNTLFISWATPREAV